VRVVVDAGILYITQCHQPLPVGASGSYMVTAKDFVPAGGFDHCSAGERFCPLQPMPLKTWGSVMRPFDARSGAVNLK